MSAKTGAIISGPGGGRGGGGGGGGGGNYLPGYMYMLVCTNKKVKLVNDVGNIYI